MNTHALRLQAGSSQAASATDHSSLKPTGNFTVEAWIKTSNTNGGWVFQSYSQNTNSAGIMCYVSSANCINFRMGKNTGITGDVDLKEFSGSIPVIDGKWHHVAWTWDGTTMRIFVDGVADTTAAWANAPVYAGTNYVRVGCYSGNGSNSNFFEGQLHGVRLFNGTARTQTQIREDAFTEFTGSETNLAASWPLNNSYNDQTSNANNLTSTGSPAFVASPPFATDLSGSTKKIFITGGNNWVVPADWASGNNSIEVIGAGGAQGGNGRGGSGGGAYSKTTNFSATPGDVINFQVGVSGSFLSSNTHPASRNTYFNGSSLASCTVGAEGGIEGGDTPTFEGGRSSQGTGSTKYSGGNGGVAGSSQGGGGGGGAAGPNGAGNNGSTASGTTGADGGSADAGSGGAGGVHDSTAGGNGSEWASGWGAGGGGGGGSDGSGGLATRGGNYGGGHGGASTVGSGGNITDNVAGDDTKMSSGLIVIIYTTITDVSQSETASGTDAIDVLGFPATQADTASGVDAISILVFVDVADTNTNVVEDTFAGVEIVESDTGSGADDIVAAQTAVELADTGSGVDAFSVLAEVAIDDTGSGLDAISIGTFLMIIGMFSFDKSISYGFRYDTPDTEYVDRYDGGEF